jgi:hypothetical protein
VAGVGYGVGKLLGYAPGPGPYLGIFWALSLLLGLVGTTVFSGLTDSFILTWPASMFVAFQMTLLTISWAERQANRTKARWIARLVTILFLALCLGYYQLCKVLGIVMGWSFLIGFVPAWPFSVLAARSQYRQRTLWLQALWALLAFTVYFWLSGLLPAWKMALSR